MDLQEIEAQAATLYMKGEDGHVLLEQAWEICSKQEALAHPEIAFQVAKIYIQHGDLLRSQQLLDRCFNAWRDSPEQSARVYLLLAHISYNEQDHQTTMRMLEQAQSRSQQPVLLAECCFLRGNLLLANSQPAEALQHFHKAYRIYLQLRAEQPSMDFDLVRVTLKAAQVALQQQMRTIGWRYQRHAEQIARELNHPDLLVAMLIKTGELWESEGQYDQAFDYYDEALQYAGSNPLRQSQLCLNRANLAIHMGEDHIAEQLLNAMPVVENAYAICKQLILKAWLFAFRYNFQTALLNHKEASYLVGDNKVLQYELTLLRMFLDIQQSTISLTVLTQLQTALDFFTSQHLYHRSTQIHLMIAWHAAIEGDHSQVKKSMDALETDLKQLGYVNHLTRLYQFSISLLGGWWKTKTVVAIEQALDLYHSTRGIRIYAFGIPRAYVGTQDLQKRERYKYSMKLLIYLLEKREATVEEIITAVWEDVEPEVARNRFHVLMNNVSKLIGDREWCIYDKQVGIYRVSPEFPDYYDVQDFCQVYDALKNCQHPAQGVAQVLKLCQLYDRFAATLDSDVFDDFRQIYAAQFDRALQIANNFLADVGDLVPQQWYEQLKMQIQLRQG